MKTGKAPVYTRGRTIGEPTITTPSPEAPSPLDIPAYQRARANGVSPEAQAVVDQKYG